MTTVIVLLLAAVAFAMGYRFFARFLLAVLPPAPDSPDAGPLAVRDWMLLARHVPALAGAVTVAGAAAVVVLGWIPGFLWVLTGTLLAAGPLGLGTLWLAARHAGQDLPAILAARLGPAAGPVGLGLAAVLAVAVAAVAVLMIERAVVNHPAIVVALLAQVAVAPWFGGALRERPLIAGLATGVAVLLLFAVVATGAVVPLTWTGTLALHAGDTALLTLDPTLSWIVLIMVYGWYVLKRGPDAFAAPRGVLSGAALAVLLGAAVVGLLLRHPEFAAPAFNPQPPLRAMPWVFALVTGGAVAGFHVLLLLPLAGRRSPGRLVGYGGALGDGAVAVLAVIVCAAGFATPAGWQAVYTAGAVPLLGDAQDVFVLALARVLAGGTRAGFELAANIGAFVVAGLALAALEGMLLAQQRLLDSLPRLATAGARWKRLAIPALTGVSALVLARAAPGLDAWLVLGATSLCLAALVLGAVCLAAGEHQPPAPVVWVPALGVAVIAAGVLAALAWRGWATTAPWLLLAAGALGVPFALAAVGAGRRARAALTRKSA